MDKKFIYLIMALVLISSTYGAVRNITIHPFISARTDFNTDDYYIITHTYDENLTIFTPDITGAWGNTFRQTAITVEMETGLHNISFQGGDDGTSTFSMWDLVIFSCNDTYLPPNNDIVNYDYNNEINTDGDSCVLVIHGGDFNASRNTGFIPSESDYSNDNDGDTSSAYSATYTADGSDIWFYHYLTIPETETVPPPTPFVNITFPPDFASLNSSPINISFELNFNASACCLYSDFSGSFTSVDCIEAGTINETTTEQVFNGTSLNPLAFYSFEEGNGSIAVDTMGKYNGTINNPSFVSSKGGNGTGSYALDFDGASTYVSIPDHDDLTLTSAFSSFAWVNMDSTSPFRIGGKRTGVSPTEWFFTIDGSGFPRMQIYDESTGGFIGKTGDSVAGDSDTWVHLGFTYSGSGISNGIKIYRNGVDITDLTTESGTFVSVENTNAVQEIGTINNHTSFADGTIDEFGLFAYELTTENVTQLYEEGIIIEYVNVTTVEFFNLSINQSETQYLQEVIIGEHSTIIEYYVNCTPPDTVSETVSYNFNNDFNPPIITLLAPLVNFTESPVDINLTTNDNSNCVINNSLWTAVFDNGTFHVFNELNPPDGDYLININCTDDGSNSANINISFTLDNIEPVINIISPDEDNSTITEYNNSFAVLIDFLDTNLFAREVLIYNPLGVLTYNFTAVDLPITEENFFQSITPDKLGNWTIDVMASDNHHPENTRKIIDVANKILNETDLTLEFEKIGKNKKNIKEKKIINIKYNGKNENDNWAMEQFSDRYKFSHKLKSGKTQQQFKYIISCEELYIIDSDNVGHIVCNNENVWIDFNNEFVKDYTVKRIDTDTAEVIINTLLPLNEMEYNSIGGVNVNSKSVRFAVVFDATEEENIFFNFNLETLPNVMLLFIIIFLYVALLIIGFVFKNMGFLTFAFFIGLAIGLILFQLHIFFTVAFLFVNITAYITGAKSR